MVLVRVRIPNHDDVKTHRSKDDFLASWQIDLIIFCMIDDLPNDKLLDDIGWHILTELQANARVSFAELGRRVGLSTPATAERVRRLEDAGIIQGYAVQLNRKQLGLPLSAFVQIRSPAGRCQSVAKALKTIPEVLECHRVTGQECYLLRVAFASMEHLERILDKLNPLGETISSVVVSTPLEHRVIEPSTFSRLQSKSFQL
jgi:Lrp/AsnC family transcriptional regulator, leucine-responsive regulatory protein